MSERRPIGAVIAMHIELDHLLAHGTVESVESRDSWKLWRCTIGDEPVVAILSGIGMINAAAATEYLIASCNPRAVVNSGCTGAHLSELAQGDVVIGTSTVYPAALQVLASGEARHVGFSFDSVTGLIEAPALPADPALLAIARQVEKSIDVPAWPDDLAWDAPEPRREARIVEGPVASADIWTQEVAGLDRLHRMHGSLCEDMEAASINQIAARHGRPFLTIKDIINNERHAQTRLVQEAIGFEADFPIQEAGRRAAIVLAEVIKLSGELD